MPHTSRTPRHTPFDIPLGSTRFPSLHHRPPQVCAPLLGTSPPIARGRSSSGIFSSTTQRRHTSNSFSFGGNRGPPITTTHTAHFGTAPPLHAAIGKPPQAHNCHSQVTPLRTHILVAHTEHPAGAEINFLWHNKRETFISGQHRSPRHRVRTLRPPFWPTPGTPYISPRALLPPTPAGLHDKRAHRSLSKIEAPLFSHPKPNRSSTTHRTSSHPAT